MAKLTKLYEVTRTQTVQVRARNAEQAEYLGETNMEYFNADTTDIQVEEIADAENEED